MKSSFFISLLLVFPFISFSFARPSVKATDLISTVCSKALNPSLCLQVLKSYPGSASADLKGLGQISINIAQTNAKQTSNFISTLLKQATDPKLKERYDSCAENYGDAIDDLDETRQYLNSGDYLGMNIHASAALTEPDTCDEGFEGPPAEPAQLSQANKKLEDLCDIILVISNLLRGSK